MKTTTTFFTPLFNSANIKEQLEQSQLSFDVSGLFRPLEMIVLPFHNVMVTQEGERVCQVIYPDLVKDRFYTFNRFFEKRWHVEFKQQTLGRDQVLQRLQSYLGLPYLWGGNWILDQAGLEQLDENFKGSSVEFMKNLKFLFSGLDCSGLLYAATLAQVPRNTADLVHFGQGLPVDGLSLDQLMKKLQPLDLIVWKGHVLIVLDKTQLIESRHGFGVIVVSMKERLAEIRETRAPSVSASLKTFVVRRWITSL